jgi:hypothetical protein
MRFDASSRAFGAGYVLATKRAYFSHLFAGRDEIDCIYRHFSSHAPGDFE